MTKKIKDKNREFVGGLFLQHNYLFYIKKVKQEHYPFPAGSGYRTRATSLINGAIWNMKRTTGISSLFLPALLSDLHIFISQNNDKINCKNFPFFAKEPSLFCGRGGTHMSDL